MMHWQAIEKLLKSGLGHKVDLQRGIKGYPAC
jgi:hypothetical protein